MYGQLPTELKLPQPASLQLPESTQTKGKYKVFSPSLPLPLTKNTVKHAQKLLMDFTAQCWALKTGPLYCWIPFSAFWTEDGKALWGFLESLICRYNAQVLKSKVNRQKQAAVTRAQTKKKKKQSYKGSEGSDYPWDRTKLVVGKQQLMKAVANDVIGNSPCN
ncbi:hypothetical protein SERLA73DRAFT_155397 [Serpula lacrymans var. lacrymans S7.3]|uniref:Uncharacterized protein n=1 Tax=Serpula lacrymans var. lacrymans (strain S7.3) TaxID=936435 RepID=F8Q9Q8_SERL3|nr:hypothetical protein SERLA73DRAFT_155397 [Serpula lacrymans var. lacrymans S7.3]